MGITPAEIGAGIINPVGVIGNGVALGGDILNYYGTQQTNQANMDMVQSQENFQASMSNTAYQRATADMKAAGINPMLAATQGGASSPSGAIAPMQSPMSALGASLNQNVSTAQDLIKTKASYDATQAGIAKDNASADLAAMQAKAVPSMIQSNVSSAQKADMETKARQIQLPSLQYDADKSKAYDDFFKRMIPSTLGGTARKAIPQFKGFDLNFPDAQPPQVPGGF